MAGNGSPTFSSPRSYFPGRAATIGQTSGDSCYARPRIRFRLTAKHRFALGNLSPTVPATRILSTWIELVQCAHEPASDQGPGPRHRRIRRLVVPIASPDRERATECCCPTRCSRLSSFAVWRGVSHAARGHGIHGRVGGTADGGTGGDSRRKAIAGVACRRTIAGAVVDDDVGKKPSMSTLRSSSIIRWISSWRACSTCAGTCP